MLVNTFKGCLIYSGSPTQKYFQGLTFLDDLKAISGGLYWEFCPVTEKNIAKTDLSFGTYWEMCRFRLSGHFPVYLKLLFSVMGGRYGELSKSPEKPHEKPEFLAII